MSRLLPGWSEVWQGSVRARLRDGSSAECLLGGAKLTSSLKCNACSDAGIRASSAESSAEEARLWGSVSYSYFPATAAANPSAASRCCPGSTQL